MPDQLQTIVQRMLDAGESEDNIGMVISHYKTQSTPQTMSVMEMGRESAASAGAEDAQPSIWSNLKESATIRPTGTRMGNLSQLAPYMLPTTPGVGSAVVAPAQRGLVRAGDALIAHGDRLAAQPFLGRQLAVTAAEGLGEHLGIPRGVTAGVAEVAQSPTVSRMAGRLMHRMGGNPTAETASYGSAPGYPRLTRTEAPPAPTPVPQPGESLEGFPRGSRTDAPVQSEFDQLLNRQPPAGPYGSAPGYPRLTPTEAPVVQPPPAGGPYSDPGYPRLTRTEPPAVPAPAVEPPAPSAPTLSAADRAQLVRQGYSPETIARLEAQMQPAVSHQPTVGRLQRAPEPAPESPMQQPRVDIGAEKVGRAEGLSKEQVRQQTAPILGEEQGSASPILPEKALGRIVDALKQLPKGGPEREAYVQAATSGKAQWQIENIRRTLEHLGLIGAGAVALDPVRVELMRHLHDRGTM
jgi:hypothetical protein